MFNDLTEKLESIFRSLRGQGKLTEKNIGDALRDIRRALLEADVNFKVAKHFIQIVESKAMGREVLESITPGQMVVKIVHDELVTLLGGQAVHLTIKGPREIIMVCGLQGSGKTTTVAKLSNYFRSHGRKPLVASVDVHRPAAIDQLRVLARNNSIMFFENDSTDPVAITSGAVDALNTSGADLLILDTAGRLHVDNEMMEELSGVRNVLNPQHTLFVADGMTGQDAVNAVEGFIRYIEFDGVILTKLDSDARGGAALSIRHVTGKPILFVGTGERIDAFEVFYPERYASRILGMGDIVSLVEKAQTFVDEKKALEIQEKIRTSGLTLDDFLDQLKQIQKMGPIDQLLGMIPGIGKMMKGIDLQGNELKRVEAIILSMTSEERKRPHIIDGSRRRRIALGSGTSLQDVNNLLKQFTSMQKMMKKMPHMGGRMKSPHGLRMPF
ncbi:signal recognition particle protein [bacterium]|nr:signal recognition particle protein [bacterium]